MKQRSVKRYVEDFENGAGGWYGWISNQEGLKKLELAKSAVISRSPWWVDYNHAPPGAGYLHMVYCMATKGPFGEAEKEFGGTNGFVAGEFPTDLTNAEMTFRLKGELLERGAHLVLLVQATVGPMTSGWVLQAQPIKVDKAWSKQTIKLAPDPGQWTCLGARRDRTDFYGKLDLKQILADVNGSLMLILFPLNVVPMGPIAGNRDILRPGRDYPVWRSELPEGYVVLDKVEIKFSGSGGK